MKPHRLLRAGWLLAVVMGSTGVFVLHVRAARGIQTSPVGPSEARGVISVDKSVTWDATAGAGVPFDRDLGAPGENIQVFDAENSVAHEVWTGVAGRNIADIPVDVPPTLTDTLGILEGTTDYGDSYGERIRGYFTAPVTGSYFFWIAASDSAELWISNDSEPVNRVRRAYVSPSVNPAARQWNVQPNQKSPWLALVAGQAYYLEILHKAGVGPGDNWAVAWLQDPTGTATTPSGVVPGSLLSPFYPSPPADRPGMLYSATMLAQPSVASTAVGSATLSLSPDGSQAILNVEYHNLSSPKTGEHIHCDPYLNQPGQIVFDLDSTMPQPDQSYVWNVAAVGTLQPADLVEIIREGKAYINVHTVKYPGGEIGGHFTLANGTQTFTPPPSPPGWTDDHTDANAAARFLVQATFGPTASDIAAVQALGYEGWINSQFSLLATYHLPYILANVASDPTTPYPSTLTFIAWWQQSVTAPDQLRQRVAFALGEILVVSANGGLQNNARALSDYYDVLLDNAFGNFRTLLKAVTLTPAMGIYLDMRGNDAGDIATGRHANENYAREILQLFSIGLNRLWPDGTLILDSRGNLVPTYDQSVVMGFASVFTGWNYGQPNQANGRLPANWSPSANYTDPMVLVPTHHERGTKRLLDNVVLPQAWGDQAKSTSASSDNYALYDLEAALDSIFSNENVGPFVCRQLIQRLVTSNPSRGYLYRVVQKFNDNGAGVRGDLQAVIRAILLDYEARSATMITQPTYGKQREPLLRATAVARAFPAPAPLGATYSENGDRPITVATTTPHRLGSGDTVFLTFADTSGQPAPSPQGYSVTVTSATTFTVSAPGVPAATYTMNASTITVSLSGHGLLVGSPVYLIFTTGGATNGLYSVAGVPDASHFAVGTADAAVRSGSCIVPKLTAGGYTQSGTTISVSISGNHYLKVGDQVYLDFTSGTASDGQYGIAAVPDATHFTVTAGTSANQTRSGVLVYPLQAPPLIRAGTALIRQGTWSVGATDSSLTQTPLRSPTVFNFFFPDFKFPGVLASAGLTTPEFQLSSDTESALQMNFLAGGLLNNTGNTNGISSFIGGNGAMVIDLGPWMTQGYTANSTAVGSLVNALDTLLTGGRLSPSAKTAIVNYVANTANFPYSSSPTSTQMRDRVRAVVHLLVMSPDFVIQR
jgi:hypothetical protein